LALISELKAQLDRLGHSDIMIAVGGVLPPDDVGALTRAGAQVIFPPGTVVANAAEEILLLLGRRLGHDQAAE
jgi:methylmalonyl-CoA mutase